jgi:predicted Zn finger-like uncharacterized protein
MLITCPNCATLYDVKPQALGQSGRTVRCARCSVEWFASSSAIPSPPAQMPARRPQTTTASDAAAGGTLVDQTIGFGEPVAETRSADGAPAEEDTADEFLRARDQDSALPATDAHWAAAAASAASQLADIETEAARRFGRSGAARRKTARRPTVPVLPTIVAAQMLAVVALLVWRGEVVRVLPPTASLFRLIGLAVNLRGLVFAEVHTTRELQEGVAILVIEGTIENITGSVTIVPRLRFALRNAGGAELVAWTAPPDQAMLGPGEKLPFRSRLALPPPDGNDIVVRFLNRRDITGGGQ